MATGFLAIYIALVFLRPMEWWSPLVGVQVVSLAALITLFASIPRLLKHHMAIVRIPEVELALGLLLATSLSCLPPSVGKGMLVSFQEFGKVIVLYVLIVLVARDPRSFHFLLWTVLGCIGLMAIHGILQTYMGAGFGGQEARPRMSDEGVRFYQIIAYGIFNDPNDLCLAFVCAIPLLYSVFRAAKRIEEKWIALIMIPLVVFGAILTKSRGGAIGIFGMLAAYAIVRTKGLRRWLIVGVGIFLVTVVAPALLSRAMSIDDDRLNAWGDGMIAFQQHPVFGVGYGGFEDIAERQAHNSFIHVLTELGLVGYTFWFLLIFMTLMHVRRAINLKESILPRDQLYLSGLFSALVGYLSSVYFLSRSYNPVLYIFLALAIAQVFNATRQANAETRVVPPLAKDIRLPLVWCLASVPVLWVIVRIANALGGR